VRSEVRHARNAVATRADQLVSGYDSQVRQVKEKVAKAKSYLRESVWQGYKNVFLLDEGNQLRRIHLRKSHSSVAPSLADLVVSRLRQEELFSCAMSVNTLVRNWPPVLLEWTTKSSVRDAFYASAKFSRLSNADIAKRTISRGVTGGQLAYAGKRDDQYEPFVFKKPTMPSEIEIGDDLVVLQKEYAEKKAAIDAGKPAKPSSIPPPEPVVKPTGGTATKQRAATGVAGGSGCSGFTAPDHGGSQPFSGQAGRIDFRWTEAVSLYCDQPGRIYCFEQ
jgi:hypothetical protein